MVESISTIASKAALLASDGKRWVYKKPRLHDESGSYTKPFALPRTKEIRT